MDLDSTTPIAIVGLSFQLPGGAISEEALWSMLMEKRCASSDFPADRLDGSAFYHPDRTRGDSVPLKGGHFIQQELGAFDAPFFSVSAAEAEAMDPQSRALLETTYRALENAGESMESISNSNTSVYTGNLADDYKFVFAQDIEQNSKHGMVGMTGLLSGRISWFFNLKGPNLTVDTACSSSLVALDLGCQSLHASSSDMAIVTGCSLLFAPNFFHMLSNMGMLSPDSKCFSFDHRANGYGRGEGIVALILKRLPDALRDNNTIRGIIRSTGVNYDGRTPGVTQPNGASQLSLIRDTYKKAGLSMEPTRYFEAHGTGTPVGDLTETTAIGSAFHGSRAPDDPLYIGSIKSNIGHTEGASGISSVIKAILVLERGVIPPNTNFELLNPNIDVAQWNIKVAENPTRWPTRGLRRASINSFGASGTNAHVILDDASSYLGQRGLGGNHCTVANPELPEIQSSNGIEPEKALSLGGVTTPNGSVEKVIRPHLLILSAFDKPALNRVLDLHSEWMEKHEPEIKANPELLQDLAYTLLERRSHLRYRNFAVIDEDTTLSEKRHFSPAIRAKGQPRTAFIFTGQGAQWAGMGRDLLRFPVCCDAILEANAYLKAIGARWDVIDALSNASDNSDIDHPVLSQTLCTVLQVALCDLYRALHVHPSVVVGHSSGEIAAAYCIGAISRKSAFKLAYYRGLQAAEVSQRTSGGMMAVAMSASDIEPLLEKVANPQHSLTIACINSPENVTISGDRGQLEELAIILEDRQIFHRRLRVDLAYHSAMMGTASEAYKQDVGALEPGTTSTATDALMISSVTGKVVDASQLRKVEYWVQNMLRPVLFSDAVSNIWHSREVASGTDPATSIPTTSPVDLLVEVGPHPALQSPIRDILRSLSTTGVPSYYSSMKRHTPVHRHLLATLGYLSCHGVKINFGLVNSIDVSPHLREHRRSRRVIKNLPEYPFDHSCVYMPSGRLGRSFRFRKHAKLDLLGKPVVDWNPLQPRWRNFLKQSELPWVKDHKINNTVIYPAVGMLAMAIEAANQLADPARTINGFKLTDAYFMVALTVPASAQGIETQLTLSPSPGTSDRNSSSWKFRLFSHDGAQWQEHCHGTINIDYARRLTDLEGREDLERLKYGQTAHEAIGRTAIYRKTKDEFYDSLFKSGYTFGPAFRAMDDLTFNDQLGRQATASINCFDWRDVDGRNHFQQHVIHPTTLDGILQVSIAAFTRAGEDVVPTAVPAEIEYLWVAKDGLSYPGAEMIRSVGTLISQGNVGYETSVIALDDSMSRVTLEAKGIKLRFVTGAASAQDQARNPPLPYSLQWKPDIDLLKTETHLSTSSTQVMEFEGDLTDAQALLINFLDLVTFKKPDMKILHIANSEGDDEKILLEKVFQSQGVSGPTFPCSELVSREPGLLTSELTKTDGYDLVIDSHSSDTLCQAHQLLNPGGKLALLLGNGMSRSHIGDKAPHQDHNLGFQRAPNGEEACRNSETTDVQRSRDLEQAGFTHILRYITHPANTAMLTVASKSCDVSAPKPSMSYVLVIEATQFQEEMARILQHELESASFACTTCYLNQLNITGENSQRTCIFISELEHPLLQDLSPEVFSTLRDALVSTKGLLWLTSRDEDGLLLPDRAMVDGLTRVLRSENELAVIVTAVLAHSSIRDQAEQIMTLIKATDFGTTDQHYEASYLQVNDVLHIGRLKPETDLSKTIFDKASPSHQSNLLSLREAPPLRLAVGTPGLLDSLYFYEDVSVEEPLPPGWVEIQVVAVGLNFKDLLLALGRENGTTFGNECAGVIHRVGAGTTFQIGERVCVFSPTAFSTYTRVEADKVAKVPDSISLAHAAAVPTQFVTSWYALHNAAKIQKGESILIHSAAGGTGQAALQVAQLLGAEIFATVGSEEKKKFLVNHYGIPEDHIFYSRNTTFAQGILRLTNGRGADVVLNSLSGEGLLASWDIIAPHGRFIELGKKDIAANNSLPMRPFLRRATFTALEIGAMAAEYGPLGKQIIDQVLDLFVKGSLRPVETFKTLPISKIQEGMRILQSGQSIGKIVFEMTGDAPVPVQIRSKPTWCLEETKTYVIAGGTGGLGLMIADWMVKQKGARNLLLLSRSGLRNAGTHAENRVKTLRELGAVIEAPECDITDINALRKVVEGYRGFMPPIAGCIQSSMVLKDAVFANMPFEDWEASTKPKTRGSWNLHSVLPKGLDFFILLSSISGIVGSAGQANYAAGNTYMDALAHYRNALGERATALDLGVIVDHGFLAANETLRKRILSAGLLRGIDSSELLALLDHYCEPTSPHTPQIAIGLAPASELKHASPHSNRSFLSLPFYQHVFAGAGETNEHASEEDRQEAQRKQDFLSAQTLSDAGAIVSQALLRRLISITPGLQDRVDAKNMDEPIQTFGVDSLQAIELRSWFAREFAADIPIFAILGEETLASIGLLVANKSKLRAV